MAPKIEDVQQAIHDDQGPGQEYITIESRGSQIVIVAHLDEYKRQHVRTFRAILTAWIESNRWSGSMSTMSDRIECILD